MSQNSDKDVIRQQELLEKLQRLSNLKRKSDVFLQNSFYNSDISASEKRPKFKDKNQFTVQNINHTLQVNDYDQIHKIYDERVADSTSVYPNHVTSLIQVQQNNSNTVKECKDKNKIEHMANNGLQVKTECEDSDNLPVTDNCISPKSYDGTKDDHNNSIDYHAVQDSEYYFFKLLFSLHALQVVIVLKMQSFGHLINSFASKFFLMLSIVHMKTRWHFQLYHYCYINYKLSV